MIAEAPPAALRPGRFCIVTGEFIGPRPCGGIGTAMTGLARTLAAAGHEVTVLYTRGMWLSGRTKTQWARQAAEAGIVLEFLSAADVGRHGGPLSELTYTVPCAVLDWLSSRSFDLVHFNEMEGDGWLALAARRAGTGFSDMPMAVAVHSPTAWIEQINREIIGGPLGLVMRAAERFVIEGADQLWGPSAYLLDWLRSEGYTLVPRNTVLQYVLPPAPPAPADTPTSAERVTSLVFFGRLEERKGLLIFLDALDRLADRLAADGIEVVFLGKSVPIAGTTSTALISARARRWRFRWRQISGLTQPDAVAFLREPGRLAVMASPADNSPCTVYEAMQFGFPFIAAHAGGIPELIRSDEAATVLFTPDRDSLVERLEAALGRPPKVPRPARTIEQRRDAWLAVHDLATGWPAEPGIAGLAGQPEHRPLVVLVQDVGDDQALARSLDALTGWKRRPDRTILLSERPLDPKSPEVDVRHPVRDDWLAAISVQSDVLAIVAGAAPLENNVRTMAARRAQTGSLWFLPSVMLGGKRCDTPPLGAAIALAIGSTPLGVALVDGASLANLKPEDDRAIGASQPFAGLFDQLLLAGVGPAAYPATVADIDAGVLVRARPKSTPARIALFAGVASAAADIARIGATQGIVPTLLDRRAAYWLARTRLAWMTPMLVTAAEKLRARVRRR